MLSYPRETVIAEKFQAMVQLGIANTRMKDFHDLKTLSELFDFDSGPLPTLFSAHLSVAKQRCRSMKRQRLSHQSFTQTRPR